MKNTELLESIGAFGRKLAGYRTVVFCLVVAGVYGFLFYQISTLSSREPKPEDVDAGGKTAKVLRLDPKVISQLQSLQDNSANVKTLFNDARSNPFQE